MKAIELTKEHKVKLLEMCKKLFKDYYIIQLYDNKLTLVKKGKKGFPDESCVICWFEFCFTKLYNALSLLNSSISQDYLDNLWCITMKYKEHPVDYLYAEFLKLKL